MSNIIFGEDVAASKNPGNISSEETFHQSSTKELRCRSKYLIPILVAALKVQKGKGLIGETEEFGLIVPEKVKEEPFDIPELKELEIYGKEWTIQYVFTMVGVEDDDVDEGSEMSID
ncbi:hypothetical protein OCU04_002576 [Sclerotinia nivalis]|uniref:Uncharacterized protein n=1 Tax=Sclerotinia nivalis TaxID=352851 RepID=A0A9X0ATX3_9HELO|nr:hypothetical protein OCU04_002576 [Sclerotinia nivalis]